LRKEVGKDGLAALGRAGAGLLEAIIFVPGGVGVNAESR
jgi:hypothetical protein